MTNLTPRRHHYVWRRYLRAWTSGGKIWCRRHGSIFPAALMNIGQERDFYKLKELTTDDVKNLEALILASCIPKEQKEINLRWLEAFQRPFKARQLFNDLGLKEETYQPTIDHLITSIEESLHSQIEETADPIIERLLALDKKIFSSKEDYSDFVFFLATQYLRTKNMKVRLAQFHISTIPGFADRALGALRAIFSTNIGASLYRDRAIYKPAFLINNSTTPFITGDQPVINLSEEKDDNDLPKDIEFYYPISPKVAILISKNNAAIEVSVNEGWASELNRKIAKDSHEKIFAKTREELVIYSEFD